jgi:hypothetical protein
MRPADRLAAIQAISPTELASVKPEKRAVNQYVVAPSVVADLIAAVAEGMQVLDVDGLRSVRYESVYYDTSDLDLYLDAARGRRRRFKVRTRFSPSDTVEMLEVKQNAVSGEGVTRRERVHGGDRRQLAAEELRFIDQTVGRAGASEGLTPTLSTRYRRSTLVDPANRIVLTHDENLVCTDWSGRHFAVSAGIVEISSRQGSTAVDRWLWRCGIRPERLSKYGVGLAVLHPHLPSNKWHRTIMRYFDKLTVRDR